MQLVTLYLALLAEILSSQGPSLEDQRMAVLRLANKLWDPSKGADLVTCFAGRRSMMLAALKDNQSMTALKGQMIQASIASGAKFREMQLLMAKVWHCGESVNMPN